MLYRGENEPGLGIPKTFFFEKFWQSVYSGKPFKVSHSEANSLADKAYFGESPLVQLNKKEEQFLRSRLQYFLFSGLNHSVYAGLAANPVVYLPSGDRTPSDVFWHGMPIIRHGSEDFFLTQRTAVDAVRRGHKSLTVDQKIALYTNSELIQIAHAAFDSVGSHKLLLQGSRNFFASGSDVDNSYGFNKANFQATISYLRKRLGRQDLSFCDLGGNTGLACHDLKKVYPNFKYTNITIDESLGMWSGITHLFVPAERLPAKLKESFDIVVGAHNSLRHFIFQDIAVYNVLEALTVGGYANIEFSYDNSPIGIKAIEERALLMFKILDSLQRQNLIRYKFTHNPPAKFEGKLEIFKEHPFSIAR